MRNSLERVSKKARIHYEPVMVLIVGSILFLLVSLVGINTLLYLSVPDHIGPNEAYIQLSKRVDEIEGRAVDHYSIDNYKECRGYWYRLDKRVRYLEAVGSVNLPGAGTP